MNLQELITLAIWTGVFVIGAILYSDVRAVRKGRQSRVTTSVGGVDVYTMLSEDGSFCIGCEVKNTERTAKFRLQNQSVVEDEWIRTAARKIFQNSFEEITFNGNTLEARMPPQVLGMVPKLMLQTHLKNAIPALAEIRRALY